MWVWLQVSVLRKKGMTLPVSMWMKGEILMAKDYEDLTITDDFMFGKIMEDRELCLEKLKMV